MKYPIVVIFWAASLLAALVVLVPTVIACLQLSDVGWPVVIVAAFATIWAGVAWNREIRLPQNPVGIALLAISGAIVCYGLFESDASISGAGSILTITAACISHVRRVDVTPLTAFGLVWGPCVAATAPAIAEPLFHFTSEWTLVAVGGILHLLGVPHIVYGDALVTESARYFIEPSIQSVASPVMSLTLAIAFSAVMRRNWMNLSLNTVVALLLTIAFHCTTIALNIAHNHHRWDFVSPSVWPWLSGIACVITFLSADRFFEAMWYPIGVDENASQANPFVHLWNVAFERMPAKPARHRKMIGLNWSIGLSIAALIFLLAGLAHVPLISKAANAYSDRQRTWFPAETLVAKVFGDATSIDHVMSDAMIKSEWGYVSDTWYVRTRYYWAELSVLQTPESTAKFRKSHWSQENPQAVGQDASELGRNAGENISATAPANASVASASPTDNSDSAGGTVEDADGIESAKAETPQPEAVVSNERFEVTELFSLPDSNEAIRLAAYVMPDGTVRSEAQQSDESGTRGPWAVRMMVVFPGGRNARLDQEVSERFEMVIQLVASERKAAR